MYLVCCGDIFKDIKKTFSNCGEIDLSLLIKRIVTQCVKISVRIPTIKIKILGSLLKIFVKV